MLRHKPRQHIAHTLYFIMCRLSIPSLEQFQSIHFIVINYVGFYALQQNNNANTKATQKKEKKKVLKTEAKPQPFSR